MYSANSINSMDSMYPRKWKAFTCWILLAGLSSILGIEPIRVVSASPPPAEAQLNTFNATEGKPLHVGPIKTTKNVDDATAKAVEVAADFERSNWAGYSVYEDPFYTVPKQRKPRDGGALLKVQENSNASLYTLPPQSAISRILFTTKTLNGSVIPASAYVLWPWNPREFSNVKGIPVVGWAHGTTGITGECAPSHLRNLWYQYHAPFPLAIQGYAVVAPDYAGLGVDKGFDGEYLLHQWAANPAGANDLVYAVQAAQKAFPDKLSKEFVTMGHSEGGGIAWKAAERQKKTPVPGYLGSVAVSPTNNVERQKDKPIDAPGVGFAVSLIASTITTLFKEFKIEQWLTPAGIERLNLYRSLRGCQAVAQEVFFDPEVQYLKPNWFQGWELGAFENLMENGGDREISGPLLVLQGTADKTVPADVTTDIVNSTCAAHSNSDINYSTFKGVDHVPTMYASQRVWLEWIYDRFNGVKTPGRCTDKSYSPPIAVDRYEDSLNYFMEYPVYPYEVA